MSLSRKLTLYSMGVSSDRSNYFTKHLFGAGIECPTKLFYYAHNYPENQQSRPFIEHAIYNKRLLNALAQTAYPKGIFVEENSISEAADQTNSLLQREEVVLFDAIFEHQQMMARLPIVEKNDNRLTVFYTRTKAFNSRRSKLTDKKGKINSKWRKYLLDFAYQLFLVRKNWPNIPIDAVLVMPERSELGDTDNLPFLLKPLEKKNTSSVVPLTNQKLMVKLNVSDLIEKVWDDAAFAKEYLPRDTFENTLAYFRRLYFNKEKAGPEIGLKCKVCEFRVENDRIANGEKSGFNECWKPYMGVENPSEHHVFDLIGPGTNRWVLKGTYDQREIPADDIFTPETIVNGKGRISHTMRQALQISKVKGENIPEEIFRPAIFQELDRWEYPLHFLDFEAGNYAVPVRSKRAPYHLVVTQFSCHTLYQNGSWTHHQWVDDLRSGYVSYQLVRKLMKVPGITDGTIIQYSDFERNALKTILGELKTDREHIADADELIHWIEKIIHRNDSTHHKPPYIADLSRLVKNFYYNREMGNSLSIKDVLQSVMSHSDFLKEKYSQPYFSENFDGIVWWQPDGNGGARNPYNILVGTGDAAIRRGTEAMVVYGKYIARELSEEEKKAYQSALLKYCELDTLAMMMIFEHWQQKKISR